ncbi:MAG TPA: glycosyltransferase family 2 protein [Kiritimatiellia bacterium]|nr:glycosyltransferase family 2 protein [Kiritimatiellia bacterium]HMP35744.1 glycosyltransferase family 2 protein [Kiritimatiellia bacterium]
MDAHAITLIIPALNEVASIADVVRGLRAALPAAEVIVVDDGSTDGTGDAAREAGARVIRHEVCRGYGSSLKSGVLASGREFVLFCDADGQHRVEDVVRIASFGDAYDMVVGARTRDSHAPTVRRPGKWILRNVANYLARQELPDFNSGLRMIRRSVLLRYLHLMPEGFSFSTTSTFALIKAGYSIHWEPITVLARKGTSSVRQWKHGPQTVLLILRLTVLFEPLRVFLQLSAALGIATLASFAKDVLKSPWDGLGAVTTILALATLLVFLFGLLCDQVSAVRREMHDFHNR